MNICLNKALTLIATLESTSLVSFNPRGIIGTQSIQLLKKKQTGVLHLHKKVIKC